MEVNLITNDEGKVIAVDLEGLTSKIERLLVFHLFPWLVKREEKVEALVFK